MNRTEKLLLVVAVMGLIILWLGLSSWSVVSPGNRGVRVTMGSVSPESIGEGVSMKSPFPFAKIHSIPIQQQTVTDKAACFSKDMQTIRVEYTVMFRVPPAKVVELFQQYNAAVDTPSGVFAAIIQPRIQEALKQVTATYNAEEIVQKREQVREGAFARVKEAVGDLVIINDINLVNIDLTDELEKAIELKMIQQQKALAKNYELDTERKQAEITVVQATAQADALRVTAKALAESPNVLQLEIVKKWDGKAPQTVVSGSNSGVSLLMPAAK